MTSENAGAKSNHVQLIISAKSSGAGAVGAKVAELPREETRERFTHALESGCVEVFEMMVGTTLGPAEEVVLPRVADYTSMIGLAGDLCGVLSFRCSNSSAAVIATKMLGSEEGATAECMRDALGEICNMVAGAFKAHVMDIIEQCFLSVPMVVSGKDYEMHPLADGMRIQVSKSFDGALVWMTLDLHGI
jgi:chemotaxis protein CheX